MVMKKSDRKYFKNNPNGGPVTTKSTFLLKIIDDKDAIKTIGPFAKEDDASEALSAYLKSGVCSWVVSYNG